MSNHEVSDGFWAQAEPLLEPFKRRKSGGSKPLDFRQVMNGILYVLQSGCQWALLPRCYGSKSAVHEHFQRWVAGGVFTTLFRLGADTYEELCGFELTWQSMDGSLVQAPVRQARHQAEEGLGRNPTDRGRSGSKLHLQVDQNGLPVAVILAGANVHDSRLVTPTVQAGVIQPPATAARAGPGKTDSRLSEVSVLITAPARGQNLRTDDETKEKKSLGGLQSEGGPGGA